MEKQTSRPSVSFQLVGSGEQTVNPSGRAQRRGNYNPRAGISPRLPACFDFTRAVPPPLDMPVMFLSLLYLIKITEA